MSVPTTWAEQHLLDLHRVGEQHHINWLMLHSATWRLCSQAFANHLIGTRSQSLKHCACVALALVLSEECYPFSWASVGLSDLRADGELRFYILHPSENYIHQCAPILGYLQRRPLCQLTQQLMGHFYHLVLLAQQPVLWCLCHSVNFISWFLCHSFAIALQSSWWELQGNTIPRFSLVGMHFRIL